MSDEEKLSEEQRSAIKRGAELRRARQAHEMSQADLAEKTGLKQQTIDRIERGTVLHSKAYPVLRQYFKLDLLGYDTWPYEEGEDETAEKRRVAQVMREGRAIDKVDRGMIPVISNRSGNLHLADAVPRVFPFEYAEGCSAYLITTREMEPVLKVGDIVVVNPHVHARIGDEIAYGIDDLVFIRTFIGETEDDWIVTSWSPKEERKITKTGKLEKLDVVVAKYNRNR